jgi:uracil-DNA glycosylase family 4
MKDWIFGTGPTNAKLMIIGEAPGAQEAAQGKPFVGPSGELITELLEVAGLNRRDVYLTNIIKIRPPENPLGTLQAINNPETGKGYKAEDFFPLLWKEIEALQPNCILALGRLAMETLTHQYGKITDYRGSIFPCLNYGGKVVITIHPASIFDRTRGQASEQGMFTWKQKAHIQFDFIKAARECKTSKWNMPRRDLRVVRTSREIEQFFKMYKDYDLVYCDTEVLKAHLVCIGFAFTPHEAISIPLIDLQSNSNPSGIPLHDMKEIWKIVAQKLADPALKIGGQNFKGDKIYWLETAGFEVNGFCEDAMLKMHTLSPELPKSQAFQASVFTNEPFYKNEGREYNPNRDKLDVLLKYNAKDCAVNAENDLRMNEELEELGLKDFYYNFVMLLHPIYEAMEKKGILIDTVKQKKLRETYTVLLEMENEAAKVLLAEFGINETINYNSPKQVAGTLFIRLHCPMRKDTRDVTLTALMNNAVRHPQKKKIIKSFLDRRSLHKLRSTYINANVDFDGRMRYSYNQVGTETGRTSSSIIQRPARMGKWGVPVQQIPRPDEFGGNIRSMFICDPGKILINFDQAQAEARVVAILAEDYEFLELMDLVDVHRLTAAFCNGLLNDKVIVDLFIKETLKAKKAPEELLTILALVTKDQRHTGKAARHGLAYDLQEQGLAIKMKISLWRAKETYKKVHEMSPKIKSVYHEAIEHALAENDKVLWTPFGRRREFFNKWGRELFREAYAHYPQSVVGDQTKMAMLAIHQAGYDWIEFLQEGHDSFLAQIPEGRQEECYTIVKPLFEVPIDFQKGTIKRPSLLIPIDCQIGYSWGEMKDYKV